MTSCDFRVTFRDRLNGFERLKCHIAQKPPRIAQNFARTHEPLTQYVSRAKPCQMPVKRHFWRGLLFWDIGDIEWP